MKCILCNKRKVKRHCPALGYGICPLCCGEKRGVEINCPSTCEYFVEGQKHHQQKITRKRIREEGVAAYVKRAELYEKDPVIFDILEKEISKIYRSDRAIKDKDLATALEQVKKTLEAEISGIYYEYMGENVYANRITRHLLDLLKEYMMRSNRPDIDVKFLSQVVDQYFQEALFYMKNSEGERDYLVHISRYHPEATPNTKEPVQRRLIIP